MKNCIKLAGTMMVWMALSESGWAAPGDLYPQGDVFCFTFYSTKPADSVSSLAHGATAIGPYYGTQSDDLARAETYDTKFLYKVEPPSMAGMGPADRDDPGFVWPSDTQISNEVAAIVSVMQANPHIGLWDMEPEEMRWFKPQEMHYLDVVYEAIHANDPSNRPVYMYEPNHRTASDLEKAVIYQDLCAKGTYVSAVDSGAFKYNRIWARWSMQQELTAIANANTSATPWIVLWMAADAGAGEFGYIDDWCRHDAYMGLIMGGKGIQIWSGFRGRAGFSDPHFDAYLDGYLSVAEDLNGALDLAPVFLYGTKQGDVNMNITSGPTSLQLDYRGQTNFYPPITYLSTIHGGTEYLFMVNSATQDVTATFSGLSDLDRNDLFGGDVSPNPGGSFSVTLGQWEVKAFSFGSQNPATSVVVEDVASIGFETHAGRPYTLEFSTDPITNWTGTGMSVIGDGAILRLYDVTGGSTSKNYRVTTPSL